MPDSAAAKPPVVTVIIVNYRSAELTLQALERALASAEGLAVEEIVVDGASGGEEAETIARERPQATVVALEENLGFAAGNNVAIARARGRYLLLCNPDAFAEGDAVRQLVDYAEHHSEVGVVAPLLHNSDGSLQDNAYRRFPNLLTLFVDFCAPLAFLVRGTPLDPHNVPRRGLTGPRAIAHAMGAVLLVRAQAVHDAGRLDERFFLYLEETEWQRRISSSGWRIDVLPSAGFTHLGGGSSTTPPLASRHYLESIRRYYPRPAQALRVVAAGGLISRVSLRLALALRLGTPRLHELYETFVRLKTVLRELE